MFLQEERKAESGLKPRLLHNMRGSYKKAGVKEKWKDAIHQAGSA